MIHLIDREDQVKWLVGKNWSVFSIMTNENEFEIYSWLENNTKHRVVISGDGKIPPSGGMFHPTDMIFRNISGHRYKIYFENEGEALLFKLAWGGEI